MKNSWRYSVWSVINYRRRLYMLNLTLQIIRYPKIQKITTPKKNKINKHFLQIKTVLLFFERTKISQLKIYKETLFMCCVHKTHHNILFMAINVVYYIRHFNILT